MTRPSAGDLEIRAAREEDEPAVIDLLRASLGWKPEDPNEEFFRWKHHDNAFGTSPAWVALHDGAVVGYRTFLRWRFLDDRGRRCGRCAPSTRRPTRPTKAWGSSATSPSGGR